MPHCGLTLFNNILWANWGSTLGCNPQDGNSTGSSQTADITQQRTRVFILANDLTLYNLTRQNADPSPQSQVELESQFYRVVSKRSSRKRQSKKQIVTSTDSSELPSRRVVSLLLPFISSCPLPLDTSYQGTKNCSFSPLKCKDTEVSDAGSHLSASSMSAATPSSAPSFKLRREAVAEAFSDTWLRCLFLFYLIDFY